MFSGGRLIVFISILAASHLFQNPAFAQDLTQNEEKTWAIPSHSIPLEIVNLRGNIKITHNQEDRIWARVTKRGALTEQRGVSQVQSILASQQLRWVQEAGQTRLSVSYKEGQEIQERLKFRAPDFQADLEVSVPAQMRLRVIAKKGDVSLQGVRFTEAEIRVDEGNAKLENSSGNKLSVGLKKGNLTFNQIAAEVDVNLIRGDIGVNDCSGGALKITQNYGKTELNRLSFSSLFLQSKEVDFRLNDIKGAVSVTSQGGSFIALGLQRELTLASDYMHIEASWNRWAPLHDSSVESRYGRIELKLPKDFQGELSVKSAQGKIDTREILLAQNRFLEFSEHQSTDREFQGFVKHRLGQLIVRSVTGAVILSKNSS